MQTGTVQLFAQAIDIDGKRIFIHKAIRFPKRLHQAFPADDLPSAIHQCLQNPEFVFAQFNRLAAIQKRIVFQIQNRLPMFNHGH